MAKVKFVKSISDKGYPVHSKKYPSSHRAANEAEKQIYPSLYKKENKAMMKMLRKDDDELMATHKKNGKFEIEDKFKQFKKSLIIHENVEKFKMNHFGSPSGRKMGHEIKQEMKRGKSQKEAMKIVFDRYYKK